MAMRSKQDTYSSLDKVVPKYEREDNHQLSCKGGRVPRFLLE